MEAVYEVKPVFLVERSQNVRSSESGWHLDKNLSFPLMLCGFRKHVKRKHVKFIKSYTCDAEEILIDGSRCTITERLWRPQEDSNPCCRRERPFSLTYLILLMLT